MNDMENGSVIIVVDMLNDFIDGSLACVNAENAVAGTEEFIRKSTAAGGDEDGIFGGQPVIFIRDHHPADHYSFREMGGEWPAHCVAGTRGGEIHGMLKPYVSEELCFDKGCDREVEQYSGFDGVNAAGQSLGEILSLIDVTDCYVCGIATEYCVKNTCEDLSRAGYRVHLMLPCLAYVSEEGHKKALTGMAAEGILMEREN